MRMGVVRKKITKRNEPIYWTNFKYQSKAKQRKLILNCDSSKAGISDGIPAVPQNRKLSEFLSEPFRGRENNSEFRSVEQK
jgi:hypothetical protein